MARLRASLAVGQAMISCVVRLQPSQSWLRESIRQMLMHGDWTGEGLLMRA
jgi:hypothetical protein